MDGASEVEAGQGDPARQQMPVQRARKRRRRGHLHGLARLAITLTVLLALGFGALAVLALSGKTIHLPVWAVAEVEQRINNGLRAAGPGVPALTVSIGAADIVVPSDWVPRIRLEDVELRRVSGGRLMTLPEARVEIEPTALGAVKSG
jgi:hypothetical protein